ncbi:MAG: hypothetical protein PHC64_03250 [Candidatus Gastranaerophilales bacterium]|nr:hypothetical protein [Candidatus Gastranaerophilales bacterium]
MAKPLKKFSAQADENLLYEVKEIAKKEGKQFQVIINEAFADLVEKKKQTKPRKNVMAIFEQSLSELDDLYRELAK